MSVTYPGRVYSEDFPIPEVPYQYEVALSDASRYNAYRAMLQEAGRGVIGAPRPYDRKWGAKHDYEMKTYGEIYKKVEIVNRGVNVTAQHTMAPGYRIIGKDERTTNDIVDWSEWIGLHHFLHNVVRLMVIYGNVFIEPVIDEKMEHGWRVIELKLLDPDSMFVYAHENGDVIGYVQHPGTKRSGMDPNKIPEYKRKKGREQKDWQKEVTDNDRNAIVFLAKDIIHLKWNPLPNSYYGVSPLESLKRTLTTYVGMLQDVSTMIRRYGTPMIVWKMGTPERPASQKFMEDFGSAMSNRNIGDDPIIPGLVEWDVVSAGERAMQIEPYIRALRDDMFVGIGTPEVALGGTSSGGLAGAEMQIEGFNRRITEFQQYLSDLCRRDLFPRELGIDFPISKADWSTIPKMVFNPAETTEQKYLRVSTIYNSNLGTAEECREMLGLSGDIPEGERAIDLQMKLAEQSAQISATRADGSTGPPKSSTRKSDKTSPQKPKTGPTKEKS